MKRRYTWTAIVAVTVLAVVACAKRDHLAPTTTLSLRIGEYYEDLVKGSTFPVEKNSTPFDKVSNYRATYVDSPAVVIEFNDPANRFTLPPTKFAGIGYGGGKVETVTTSPIYTTSSLQSLWAGVAAGLGITVRTASGLPDTLRYLGSSEGLPPLPTVELCLHAANRQLTPAATELWDVVTETVEANVECTCKDVHRCRFSTSRLA